MNDYYNKWGRIAGDEEVKQLDGKHVTLHVAEEGGSFFIFAHDPDANVIYFINEWRKPQ